MEGLLLLDATPTEQYLLVLVHYCLSEPDINAPDRTRGRTRWLWKESRENYLAAFTVRRDERQYNEQWRRIKRMALKIESSSGTEPQIVGYETDKEAYIRGLLDMLRRDVAQKQEQALPAIAQFEGKIRQWLNQQTRRDSLNGPQSYLSNLEPNSIRETLPASLGPPSTSAVDPYHVRPEARPLFWPPQPIQPQHWPYQQGHQSWQWGSTSVLSPGLSSPPPEFHYGQYGAQWSQPPYSLGITTPAADIASVTQSMSAMSVGASSAGLNRADFRSQRRSRSPDTEERPSRRYRDREDSSRHTARHQRSNAPGRDVSAGPSQPARHRVRTGFFNSWAECVDRLPQPMNGQRVFIGVPDTNLYAEWIYDDEGR